MAQVGVVALVLAVAVFVKYRSGATKKELSELMQASRAASVKGNLADLKKALKSTEEALTKDSSAGDPNAMAAALYTDMWLLHHEAGAEAKAKEFLEKAKKADAHTEERYGVEAQLMLAAGNAKGASDFVEELRKKGGSGARIYLAQAQALKAQGNLPLARAAFTAAMDKAWKDGNYACAWGEAIIEEGVPGAIDTFNKATGQNPDLTRARLGLALARVQKHERLAEAEGILKDLQGKQAELSAVEKARMYTVLAGLLDIQEQWDACIATCDQALAVNPDDAWALFYKASALAGKKDSGAAAAFDAAVKKAPAAPAFYFEGAMKLQQAGMGAAGMELLAKYEAFFKNVKNATADGKEVSWLDRDDRYWLARGDLLKDAGKLDEAIGAYDKAIEAKSVNISRAYLAKGQTLIVKKEFDKAGELLQDITPPDGTGQMAEAYMAMGEVLFAKKEWGPGCQNYAFALARMKATQTPREKLNEVLGDVEKRLKTANQRDIAKVWMEEAKPLIQQ
jgi:tetratricopeptide (TPR) repeat protein